MDSSLMDELQKLIDSKREGTHWDFKEKYDENKASLLHDILCLSNAQHKGNRYLIFGVSDPPECEIKGVSGDNKRKKQHDFINFIREQKFAGDIRPEIELRTEIINGVEIDVLIIFDHPEKPYYLREDVDDKGKYVKANFTYKRNGDTNTPKNMSADISAIALMWRERFGLDSSPLEKIKLYLLEYENWEWDGVDFAYYKYFPEFTIKISSSSERNDKLVWWDRWPVDEPLTESVYEIKYHSTQLAQLSVIHCERVSFSFPRPDVGYVQTDNSNNVDAENTYSLFYYVKDTLGYSLLHHLFMGNLTSIQSYTKPPIKRLPFMIFKNEEERDSFMVSLKENIGGFFSEHHGYPRKCLGEKMLQEEEEFAEWAYKRWQSTES